MSEQALKWPVGSVGTVVGGFTAQPCLVKFRGYILNNTAAAAATASFYEPVAVPVNSGNKAALPSAAGTLVFQVQVPANSHIAFWDALEILSKDGMYVITSAATCSGSVLYS